MLQLFPADKSRPLYWLSVMMTVDETFDYWTTPRSSFYDIGSPSCMKMTWTRPRSV